MTLDGRHVKLPLMISHDHDLAESRRYPADAGEKFHFSGAMGLCDLLETLEFRDSRKNFSTVACGRKRQPPLNKPRNNNEPWRSNYAYESEQIEAIMEGNSHEEYDEVSFGEITGVGPGLDHHDSASRSRGYCNSELSEQNEERACQTLPISKAPRTEVRSLQAEREEEEKASQMLSLSQAQTEVKFLQGGREIWRLRHTVDCFNHLLFDTGGCFNHLLFDAGGCFNHPLFDTGGYPNLLSGDVFDPCDHVSLGYPRLGVV